MGIPPDLAELDEAVREVRADIEARQRKGIRRAETMPDAQMQAL